MLLFCTLFHFFSYKNISNIDLNGIVSARMLGANGKDVFLEISIEARSPLNILFWIDSPELYFYEFGEKIANVYLYETLYINPFEPSFFVINTTINRETYESLIYNFIEAYTFNLIGTIRTNTLFFSKELQVYRQIPINIKELFENFLNESFRNSIYVENIYWDVLENDVLIECEINIFNRTGFELCVENFVGEIYLNRIGLGVSSFFNPIKFSDYETTKVSSIEFILENNISEEHNNYRYLIDGIISTVFWNTVFNFPIQIIGEY